MYRERERTALMVNELIAYFQHHGIFDYSIHVQQTEQSTLIEIYGDCDQPPVGIKELQDSLNKGRAPGMEESYDQLMSIYDEENELHMLAMHVDRGEVIFQNGMFSVCIERFL